MINAPQVAPLPLDEWDESLDFIKQDMKGRPINVHSLMAHNPELLKAWWNFRNYSVQGGALGKRYGELVILRVATHMKAWYEWGSHVERGLACGLTREEIEQVKVGGAAATWTEAERVLLNAIDELILSHGIKPHTYQLLNTYFSVPQIMDMIAMHGMYVTLGCMINTWGLTLDQHVKDKLPEDVSRAQFEKEYPRI